MFYIQDVMVVPEWQGQQLGAQLMEHIMTYIRENAFPNAFIGLMAAKEQLLP